MILTDALIDRIHRIDVETFGRFARCIACAVPGTRATALGTGYALDTGDGNPLTQVMGFAHRAPGDPEEIEAFYAGGATNWEVSVTPFTDAGTVRKLLDRGYRPGGFEGQFAQTVERVPEAPEHEVVELTSDLTPWMEANSRGWTDNEGETWEAGELVRMLVHAPGRRYVAFVGGVPAASASMVEHGDAVFLMGGTTRVPYRGRGLQAALLAKRLRDAGTGRLALIGASPGSISYRNVQRAGFEPLYSTLTLMRRYAEGV